MRFAYNHADVYLRWQLTKYLDVHEAQSDGGHQDRERVVHLIPDPGLEHGQHLG